MIISRTPLRISFLGGGSDLSSFYQHEPGGVLSTTIDKYIYINVNKKFDDHIRASYSTTEIVDDIRQLKHELVREALVLVGVTKGIEVTSISDIPSSGTGMGSSSSFTVGLLNALYAYQGHHAGSERLARQACQIEIETCGKPIGKQDQYIAAYGGLQFIRFNPDGTVFVDPIISSPQTKAELQRRLLLLYTGITRSADTILEKQKSATESDATTRGTLHAMVSLAWEARTALMENRLDDFGRLLHEAWMLKRSIGCGISSTQLDDWYDRARQKGAIGGKVLGAGGGGFLLLYAHPECHEAITTELPELSPLAFRFEPQGSKIIFVEEG